MNPKNTGSVIVVILRQETPSTKYYLRHTTVFSASILVDTANGSITGLIGREFAAANPSESADNYPPTSTQRHFGLGI
jgi:hypothetical protein